MQLSTDNPKSTILTLHDAITDSPVYRSTAIHFDEQVDLFEKWLDLLSRNLKQYVDKLNKFNLETNILCKKVIPVGIDETLIDPNFTGAMIKSFSDALQTSLAFKTKLVSDIDEHFIQPIQQFIKTHLKEFKDFRKQHEKMMEKYESQLNKYTSQSKSKEASAVREEAFRLYEARKSYVRMSGQHAIRILHFRSLVEHFLVERFSLVTASHLKEFEQESKSWLKLQSSLISWKQWLLDDKETCNYQLNQLQNSRITLETKFLRNHRPARNLERYNNNATQVNLNSKHSLDLSNNNTLVNENQPSFKWGYLSIRTTRNYWYRRWFFLYDGCFGSCTLSTSSKSKGSIILNERVSVLLCDIKPITDVDRRNCFEVICAQKPPFILQAETEAEMHEWVASFEKSKRLMLQSESFKSNPSAATDTITVQTKDSSPTSNDSFLNSLTMKSKPSTLITEISEATSLLDEETKTIEHKSSIVMLSTSPENDQKSLTQSTSLTPLLVWEASRASMKSNAATSSPSPPIAPPLSQTIVDNEDQKQNPATTTTATTSWGIPWALVPSMFQSGSTDDITSELPPTPGSPHISTFTDVDGHQIVWPTRLDGSNVPKVEIIGYDPILDTRNKELRHLFGGVDPTEVVLFDFVGLLKKKPLHDTVDIKDMEAPSSPTLSNPTVDTLEHELNAQLPSSIKEPTSAYGYGYTGRGFITQDTFWFYSCVLMHCVNTVAIRLRDIQDVRLIRDPSIPNTSSSSNLALAIDLVNHPSTMTDYQTPLIITTLMEDVEIIAEKLEYIVSNTKQSETESLQTMYDVITTTKNKDLKRIKTITKSFTDPMPSKSDITSNTSLNNSSSTSIDSLMPSKSNELKKKPSKANRKYSTPVHPKSGAIAVAMMAASVAGGSGFFDIQQEDSNRKTLRTKKSKGSFNQDDGDIVPMPNSIISSATSSTVNIPSKLAESVSINDTAVAHATPANFKIPSEPISCGCDNHYDKLEVELEVPISAKHLYYILFDEENPNSVDIWEKKTTGNKSKDLSITPWQTVDGKKERTLKYIIPVNNPMVKLKEAEVAEKQTIEKKDDYLCYVVLTSTKTAQLPYADAFVPYVKYCITWIAPDRCKLSCYIGVKFLKNILVKGMVNKAAMKGMAENIGVFIPIVKQEAEKQSNKGISEKSTPIEQKDIDKQSSIVDEKEANKQNKESSLYDKMEPYIQLIQDLISTIPFNVKITCGIFLFLFFTFSWTRAGTQKQPDQRIINSKIPTSSVTSRAVYLRDIDEGLINTDNLQSSYQHTNSFQEFMKTKISNRTLATNQKWFSSQHHQFAIEILFSRERLAMLRHDTLVLFQLVNEVDAQLLENEYANWLMDRRLQCRLPDVDYTSLYCDEVKRQLKTIIHGNQPTS